MAEAADAQAGLPYIGSLISLISNSEIRYEGTLYTIDMNNSTIALSNVRSFGTEGRRKDGPQVAPSDTLYDYIIFRGSDIKDLTVLTNGLGQQQPPAAAAAQDPAIVSATVPQAAPQAQQNLYPQQNSYLPPSAQPGPWGMPSAGQPPYAAPSQYSSFAGQSNPWAPTPAVAPNQTQLAAPNHVKPPGIASPGRQPPSVPVQQPPYQPPSPSAQAAGTVATPANNLPAPPPPPPVDSSPAVAPTVTLRPRGQESPPAASAPRSDANAAVAKPAPSSYANAAGANVAGQGGRGRGGRGHHAPSMNARGNGRGHYGTGRGPSPVPVAGRGATRAAPPVQIPQEDFNFDEALKKFNKEEVAKEVESEVKAKASTYNKDDFFDSMSCEALERLYIAENGQREDHRSRLAQQRKVDMETFGQVMRHNHGRHGGRYHSGRGRGGYGGRGGRGGPSGNPHGGPPGLAVRGGRRNYL